MTKVSVIIPMYNSEDFIRQCIQSIINQTYFNLEILVINDGSTDRSLEICQKLSELDDRILLYSQERKGVSSARNFGLDKATGEYIFFVDSDDVIHPLLIEELVKQVESYNIEMAMCCFLRKDSGEIDKLLQKISKEDEHPAWQLVESLRLEEWFHMKRRKVVSCISGIIRREYIGKLRFNEKLINGEDILFMYHLIARKIRISYTNQGWYYYRNNPNSVTHSISVTGNRRYFKYAQIIRDNEYKKKRFRFALSWEKELFQEMERNYSAMKRLKNKKGCKRLRRLAIAELQHPLYKKTFFRTKILFRSCFFCFPLYVFLDKLRLIYCSVKFKVLR